MTHGFADEADLTEEGAAAAVGAASHAGDDLLIPEVELLEDGLDAGDERRVRTWRGGDVRAVYYLVLAAAVIWGVIALRLAQPIILLQIGANVASVVFVFASWHLLYLNTRLLPEPLRPPMWRRAMLVAMSVFYATFAALSISSLV
jgi:hypothetical protein